LPFFAMVRRAFSALLDRSMPKPYIPLGLLGRYTMGGKAALRYYYFDNTLRDREPIVYAAPQVDRLMAQAAKRDRFYYGEIDEWLYQALDEFGVRGQTVAIFGSENPVYESICLQYGGKPVTLEYRKIVAEDPRLLAMTPGEYERNPVPCDAAFSISSFEHDGLGRYGDPLCPEGDLIAMDKAKRMLRPGGVLYLSVPVGRDACIWNSHRIYGKHRLPLLMKGWDLVKSFGFEEGILARKGWIQPVFVLKKP